jgi:hypothetical protein
MTSCISQDKASVFNIHSVKPVSEEFSMFSNGRKIEVEHIGAFDSVDW